MTELYGQVNSNVQNRIDELNSSTIRPNTVTFDGTDWYNMTAKKIQLNHRIVVNATYRYQFDFIWGIHFDFDLNASSDGYSEYYWK